MNRSHTLVLLGCVVFGFLSGPTGFFLPNAASETEEADPNVIRLPKSPVFNSKHPGPFKGLEIYYKPVLKVKSRKEGLETIRYITVTIPRREVDEDDQAVNSIYLTDKDGVIIGYQMYAKDDPIQTRFRINGIINYLEIYVYAPAYGLWKTAYRYDL